MRSRVQGGVSGTGRSATHTGSTLFWVVVCLVLHLSCIWGSTDVMQIPGPVKDGASTSGATKCFMQALAYSALIPSTLPPYTTAPAYFLGLLAIQDISRLLLSGELLQASLLFTRSANPAP